MKNLFLLFICFFTVSVFSQNTVKDDFRIYLDKDTALTNTYSPKTLYIIADSTPIYKNAKIKVIFPKYFDDYAWDNMVWIIFPPNVRAGYMQAKSVSSGKRAVINSVDLCYNEFPTTSSNLFDYKFAHENNQRVVTIEMQDTLPQGDTLQLLYGANGTNTYTYNSIVAYKENFSVLLDNQNNGNYVALRDQPQIVFKQANPKNINIALASTGNIGKPTLLKLMINDVGRNRAPDFTGTIQLTCTDPSAVFPASVNLTAMDAGTKDVYVTFNQNGVFNVSAKVTASNFPITATYTSNPVNISNDTINIYWGDFHTHSKFSRDGFGSDGYSYAKYAIGLDFYSGTDHSDFNPVDTFGINTKEWEQLKQEAITFNQPNRFVSFLGYENSLDNPSGHYNFIYNFDDANTQDIPMLAKNSFFTIQNFWTKLNQLTQQGKVLTIPHHTGKLFSTTGPDNGASQFGGTFANKEYKRIIEIYSQHGLGEYYNPAHNLSYDKFGSRSTKFPCFAQDAWALGEKLGVIASTDSHNGTASQTNFGVAAILSDSLNRNKLFSNLYNRHSYATTGEKIVLKFTMNKAIMGDEISIPCDSFPSINVVVNGTDVLDYIEVLKWNFKTGQYTSNPAHPIYTVIKKITFTNAEKNYSFAMIDTSLRDTSLYYVRVKQKNLVNNKEVWAWSSPIWVNKAHCDTFRRTDSLYNFNLQFIQPNIKVSWCMLDEFNTDYFVVERRNTSTATFSSLDTIYTAHIAFKDSCYIFMDKYPDDTVLYYRIKAISYSNGVQYSNTDSIRIPFVKDSVYNLKADVLADRIGVEWHAKEFFVQDYLLQKRTQQSGFQNSNSVTVSSPLPENNYSQSDFFPLKDTSYYRVIMNLQNGAFKISNLDTIVFRIDSLIQFKATLTGNDTVINNWKGVHEQSIVRYELQRSQDRITFFTIHTQLPTGHLFDTASYQYKDTAEIVGWNYYRVIQYMIDGSNKISKLDSVRKIATGIHTSTVSAEQIELKVIDNIIDESNSYLNFTTKSNQYLDGTLLIVSIDGKLHYQQDFHLIKGNSIGKVPIGGFDTGLYYLFFITKDVVVKNNFIVATHSGCTH